MSDEWFDNRATLAKFLRYLADECHLGIYDLIEVVKAPWQQTPAYDEWQQELADRREADEQADVRRKQESGG